MALPSSAPKVQCTLSKPLQAEGSVGSITSAFLSIDRTLVWFQSGETIYKDPVRLEITNGLLAFEVIPVDANGVFDLAGNMIENWEYNLRVTVLLDENQEVPVIYKFQPLEAMETLDLDLIPQLNAVSIPPATTSGSEVTVIFQGDGGTGNSGTLDGGTP